MEKTIRNPGKNNRFSRFSLALTRMVSASFFAFFVSLYGRANNAMKRGALGRVLRFLRLPKAATLRFKTAFSLLLEHSMIASLYKTLVRYLLSMRLRAFGTFLFTFGFSNCILYFVRRFLPQAGSFPVSSLVLGVFVTLASLPLLSGRETIAEALLQSRSLHFLLKNAAGFRSDEIPLSPMRSGEVFASVFGLIGGTLCIFIDPFSLVGILLCIILCCMVLFKPEFGCCLWVLLIPFSSMQTLALVSVFIFFAYMMKFLRGKRIFHFELLDGAILLFSVYAVLSGFFTTSPDTPSALHLAAFALSYFLISNLCRTRAMLLRLFQFFVFSVSFSGVLYCIKVFLLPLIDAPKDLVLFYERFSIQPVLLLCAFPLSIALLLYEKRHAKRFFYLCIAALLAFCICSLSSLSPIIACGCALLLFLTFCSRKFIFTYLVLLLGLAIALPLIPGQQTAFLWEALTNRLPSLLLSTGGLPASIFLFGLGLFDAQAVGALLGVGDFSGSLTFYTQILLSLGFCGLILLLLCVLLLTQKTFSYFLRAKKGGARLCAVAPLCAILSLFLFGFSQNILTTPALFAPLFLLIALTRSAVNLFSAEEPALVRYL